MIDLLIDHGCTNYNDIMIGAASGGHIELIHKMINLSERSKIFMNYDNAMTVAASKNHYEVINLMLKKGATDYDAAMRMAAYGGHIEIIKFMLKLGATDYNGSLLNAVEVGNIEIVRWLLLNCKNTGKYINYKDALYWARKLEHPDIVLLLLESQ